jgi:hypothetical protein
MLEEEMQQQLFETDYPLLSKIFESTVLKRPDTTNLRNEIYISCSREIIEAVENSKKYKTGDIPAAYSLLRKAFDEHSKEYIFLIGYPFKELYAMQNAFRKWYCSPENEYYTMTYEEMEYILSCNITIQYNYIIYSIVIIISILIGILLFVDNEML